MIEAIRIRARLRACPIGSSGWKEFEDACIEALTFLFVPPLVTPHIQTRSLSGIDIRDAVFPNREFGGESVWGKIYTEFRARMVLFEFKNYDRMDIGKEEVNQVLNYMKSDWGNIAILCTNKEPNKQAHIRRNNIYTEHKKFIAFVTIDRLIEMVSIKERREDPAGLIMDLVEKFYLERE
jgi:hypothetical protein